MKKPSDRDIIRIRDESGTKDSGNFENISEFRKKHEDYKKNRKVVPNVSIPVARPVAEIFHRSQS